MNDDCEQFLALIRPWLGTYKRFEVTATGIYQNRERILLSSRIILAPAINAIQRIPLESSTFWAQSVSAPFSPATLDSILMNLPLGRLEIGDMAASIPLDNGSALSARYITDTNFSIGDPARVRIPGLGYVGGTRWNLLSKAQLISEQDWILRSLNPPFSDLSDLLSYYGLPTADVISVELTALPPAGIDSNSAIKDDYAHIKVRAAKEINFTEITVGYRGFGGSRGMTRGQVPSRSLDWTDSGDFSEGEVAFSIGDIATMQLFLSYSGISLQQLWIMDPNRHVNPRKAIHSAFDPGQSILEELLFRSKRQSNRFEDGIAILLNMLGFSVSQQGRNNKLSNAPDIIAITPAGHVMLVECTVGSPEQGDQVAKILQRVEALLQSLNVCGWQGVQILPVIVTALPESAIGESRQEVQSKKIALFCRGDIENVLVQARFPMDPDKLFRQQLDGLASFNLMSP